MINYVHTTSTGAVSWSSYTHVGGHPYMIVTFKHALSSICVKCTHIRVYAVVPGYKEICILLRGTLLILHIGLVQTYYVVKTVT